MSFGLYVHNSDVKGTLFDGPVADADNKIVSIGTIKDGATSAGDTLKKLEDLIAALQTDVNQNESDADTAIAALQADVDQNESDADTAIATNTSALATLNGSGAGSVAADISTAVSAAIANLVDSAPGALDTLNELAAALGDDASFAATIASTIATLQADVDQNESDADAAIAALQADVNQNESDADTAIAALQADVNQNESDADAAIAALQADVDGNEADADTAFAAATTDRAAIRNEFAAADTTLKGGATSAGDTLKKLEDLISALQSDVDGNETDADTAIAALQADVDGNEADADTAIAAATTDRAAIRTEFAAADTALKGSPTTAGDTLEKLEDLISALQADVDGNESDADTAIATNTSAIATLNGSGAGSVAAAIAALVDSAPGTLDTLNELAAALGDDANFASTIASTIATLQADVDQNESDADAAIAALQADVNQNESDADTAIAAVQADVDQNEADADTAIAAVQADVDQNEADADAAIAALQADVDQNEADADAAFAALGTMSTQSAGAVNIDGGAIDGTVIGGSSAAAGSFTTLAASSTLAVSGESSFSSGLFPNSSSATVDLGGMQGTTSSSYADADASGFFEDSGFSNKAEGASVNLSSSSMSYFKDSGFTVAMPSYTVSTSNNPTSVAFYSDTSFTTQITSPNSGSVKAVILTWSSSDYPDSSERAGDGTRWDQVYFTSKYSGMDTNSLVWDTANYQAKIEFGSSSQLINSSWHGTAVQLRNRKVDTPYLQAEFSSNQGLSTSDFSGINVNPGGYGNISVSSVALSSGQTFNITLSSDVSTSAQGGYSNYFYFGQNDTPSLYLQLAWSSNPPALSDISSVAVSSTTYAHSSIVSGGTASINGVTFTLFNVTLTSLPSYSGTPSFSANVGSQELRYFQDISAKRSMRIKSIGSATAPTSNGTGDSALYVKQCPVNYSGAHADELFYLDAAGKTVQFTEGGHIFAPRRAMDATEVLSASADLSSLPSLASSLKEGYVFDLSAKSGSPTLSGSSQAQALTLPVPQADDIGREVKFIVLGSMDSNGANKLTLNAGAFTNSSSASIKAQIDGLDSIDMSQPYQVVKLLAIAAQDNSASADITCWKLV